jgi:Apea-like HEPN
VRDCEIWPEIEAKNNRLAVARLALQTAPIIPDSGSSLLHIWQGIESIFNVSSEVTFRTSILIAQLTSNILKPSITYDLAKQSYAIRSKAAHGSIKSIGQKEWQDAWHLLTLCVKAIIIRRGLPSGDDLMKELLERGVSKF